jgi:DNA replicative helicase MCM subunit Mcm2 (Cdc46/Mcm family)
MSREGSTLSPTLRQAWDTGNLRTLTKNSPARATNAHISIIGHITRLEARHELTETESANGFGNRTAWVAVRRSRCLPEGGEAVPIADLVERLKEAVEFAKDAEELRRSEEARELWASVYPKLSAGKPGLLGAITARAEAQVLRFSNLYALLDCSVTVEVVHLRAALALWAYCDRSAGWVFESGTGSKNADRILAALKVAGEKGLTRLQITNEVFNRHATKFEIDEALRLLHGLKLAVRKLEGTATRPAERWIYKAQQREVCEESNPGDGETGDTSHSSHPPPSKNTSSAESDTKAESLIGDELGVGRL